MVDRRLKSGSGAVVIGVSAVVIAIFINAAFSQVYWRHDLTANKIYTLSPASVDAVSNLQEPIEIRAFISPNMPPPFHNLSDQVDELLMEYEAASDGMLSYRIVNPGEGEEGAQMARGFGIEKVAIGQQTDSSASYRAVFKGVTFMQGDREQVVPDLQTSGRAEVDDFEYEFSRAILNLRQSEPRRVAFLGGAGGAASQPEFVEVVQPYFDQVYGGLLEVGIVDLSEGGDIPEEYDALVILNIDGDVGENALFAVDQFIQRGGNVGWFQSGGVLDQERNQRIIEERQARGDRQPVSQLRRPFSSDLKKLIGHLGVHLRSDAVLDREKALPGGAVMTVDGPVQINHPGTFPITDINPKLLFLRHYSMVALPVPSTIYFSEEAFEADREVFEMLHTPETSFRRPTLPESPTYEELMRVDPREEPGPHLVGAAMQGRMDSYYIDEPLPAGRSESELIRESEESRILVIGSGDFLGEYGVAGYGGSYSALGMQFFFSNVEWLAQGSDLSEIRGKNMPRFVAEVPRDAQLSIQFINIVVVPVFFLSIGSVMLIRRRRRREAFDQLGQEELGK